MGHGHVVKRPDGVRARCGGPAICSQCSREFAAQYRQSAAAVAALLETYKPCPERQCPSYYADTRTGNLGECTHKEPA